MMERDFVMVFGFFFVDCFILLVVEVEVVLVILLVFFVVFIFIFWFNVDFISSFCNGVSLFVLVMLICLNIDCVLCLFVV